MNTNDLTETELVILFRLLIRFINQQGCDGVHPDEMQEEYLLSDKLEQAINNPSMVNMIKTLDSGVY